MSCEKLFYNDSFATTFTAEVVDCFENKDHFAIVLDKTLFYPILNEIILNFLPGCGKITHFSGNKQF